MIIRGQFFSPLEYEPGHGVLTMLQVWMNHELLPEMSPETRARRAAEVEQQRVQALAARFGIPVR
ncbi:MAG: hypothetical protein DMD96_03855 [Candidatus Rokuibacteriota bacterium]|nr:MAG: hypothetical protein DMD96_03855 [Candidatus Rokubacteria bacterium]